jgi:hypothetical protein
MGTGRCTITDQQGTDIANSKQILAGCCRQRSITVPMFPARPARVLTGRFRRQGELVASMGSSWPHVLLPLQTCSVGRAGDRFSRFGPRGGRVRGGRPAVAARRRRRCPARPSCEIALTSRTVRTTPSPATTCHDRAGAVSEHVCSVMAAPASRGRRGGGRRPPRPGSSRWRCRLGPRAAVQQPSEVAVSRQDVSGSGARRAAPVPVGLYRTVPPPPHRLARHGSRQRQAGPGDPVPVGR